MNIDALYFHVLKLVRDGSLSQIDPCARPVVTAPDYPCVMVFGATQIRIVSLDCSPFDQPQGIIPYESQLGGLLCATFLSEPIGNKP